MKKLIIFILILVAAAPCALAKDKKEREKMRQEILEFKMEYLAQEMGLNEKQKSEFNKIYQVMSEERRAASHDARHLERELKKKKNPTDADYKRLAQAQDQSRTKVAEIVKKYDSKFEKFLSPKQMYQMRQGEEKFFRKMEQMHNDKKGSDSRAKKK